MKIEVGKKYINAEGRIINIVGINNNEDDYKFVGHDNYNYLESGRFFKHRTDTFDLICLVDETLYEQYQQNLITKKKFIQKHIELYTGTKL